MHLKHCTHGSWHSDQVINWMYSSTVTSGRSFRRESRRRGTRNFWCWYLEFRNRTSHYESHPGLALPSYVHVPTAPALGASSQPSQREYSRCTRSTSCLTCSLDVLDSSFHASAAGLSPNAAASAEGLSLLFCICSTNIYHRNSPFMFVNRR